MCVCGADTEVFHCVNLWAGDDRLSFNAGKGGQEVCVSACFVCIVCSCGRV